MKSLTVNEFRAAMEADAQIVDSRPAGIFTEKFIPGSYWLGLEGSLEQWAKLFLDPELPTLILTEAGQEEETARRLEKAGLKKPIGYLEGGMEAWEADSWELDMLITVESDELMMDIPFDDNLQVVDVRTAAEFESGHLKDALNLPLEEMNDLAEIANFEDQQNLYLHSEHNYRSLIAAALLKRQGIHNLRQVTGGWKAIEKENKADIVRVQTKKS